MVPVKIRLGAAYTPTRREMISRPCRQKENSIKMAVQIIHTMELINF